MSPSPDSLSSDNVLTVDITALSLSSGEARLSDVHFHVCRGECVAVIGPNGSGKSTLLRAISHELPLSHGDIYLNGRALSALSRQQRARQVAVLSQHDTPDERLLLEDYVALGRLPHAQAVSRCEHSEIVTDALQETGLTLLKGRALGTLSGGERQRAALARALAQKPQLLLLDEPTNHLDPLGRAELLALVKRKGIAVIAVLHDLSLVDPFADRVVMLFQGRQVHWDVPERVLITEHVYPVFGLHSFTVAHPKTGKALRLFEIPTSSNCSLE